MSVVIPCFNEGKIIKNTFLDIQAELERMGVDYEIIFANDGSIDNTLQVLKEIKENNKRVKVISYFPNRGPGYAYRQLYEQAAGEFVIQMDADLAMEPSDVLPVFMKTIKDADVVVASRYLHIRPDYPLRRLIPSKIKTFIYKSFFGLKLSDSCSGFFAFRKGVLRDLNLKSNGFEIHLEMFKLMEKKGVKIEEVPIKFNHKTESGEAGILRHAPKMALGIFKLWLRLRNTKSDAD